MNHRLSLIKHNGFCEYGDKWNVVTNGNRVHMTELNNFHGMA